MVENKKLINAIRAFNRFYTVNMGFLNSNYLDTNYSIAETRILYEIKTSKMCTQGHIVKTLHIDKSYLSRIVKSLCKRGIIEKTRSDDDKRVTIITLTEMGDRETQRLIDLTNLKIEQKIEGLSSEERDKLYEVLGYVASIIGKEVK